MEFMGWYRLVEIQGGIFYGKRKESKNMAGAKVEKQASVALGMKDGGRKAVEEFKAKTDGLFRGICGMAPSEVEETVKCYVQAKLDGYDMDAEVIGVAVAGTRCRGLEHESSDLDIVVELSTNMREDVLFDIFNEDGFCIGGIKVDINPITAQGTGTLGTYLPEVEGYLDGVREARARAVKKAVRRKTA